MRLLFAVAACIPLLGQTTPAAPEVVKAPGDQLTLEVAAKSEPGKAPVSMTWDVVFPAQLMAAEGDPELSSAAKDAGKALHCTLPKPYAYSCELSGGKKPIADGTVAVFKFRIQKTAEPRTTLLKVETVVGTSADGTRIRLNDTQSAVVIKRAAD